MELLIVIVVIGILAAITIIAFNVYKIVRTIVLCSPTSTTVPKNSQSIGRYMDSIH